MYVRRKLFGLLGTVVVAALFAAPAAAQASPVSHPAASVTASTLAKVVTRGFTLPSRECAALRQSEHNESASCAGHEIFAISSTPGTPSRTATPAASAASSTYYKGWGVLCGGTPGGPCKSWWVDLHMAFTTSGGRTWDNGSTCSTGGTPLTGCAYYGNGTSKYELQASFSTTGFFRWWVINGDEAGDSYFTEPAWANFSSECIKVNNGCYS
jgi:hypothetical protein